MPLVGLGSWFPAAIVGGLVLTSFLLWAIGSARALVLTHSLRKALRAIHRETPVRVVKAAGRVRCRRVPMVVDSPEPFSVCTGLLFPQVVISTGLLLALGEGELEAVIAHEAAHARKRDPLRSLLARRMASSVFFFPVLDDLAESAITSAEVAADLEASKVTGRRALVSALLVAAGADLSLSEGVSQMAGGGTFEARLHGLQTGSLPRLTLRPSSLVLTALTAALLAVLLLSLPKAPSQVIRVTVTSPTVTQPAP